MIQNSDRMNFTTNPKIDTSDFISAATLRPRDIKKVVSTVPGNEQFMVGNSPEMLAVFELIRRFGRCDVPVLIAGESGTGKELAARAIHERSARGSMPFVAINCAALPANLIASELFGYEKGAFTGAFARKLGQMERAHGGTLFLDEIGDIPLELQGHLLRVLQEGEIVRVGGHLPIKIDVRIISATNIDLFKATKNGCFREDLFYRLNVLNLNMPPLRERGEDIDIVSTFFLRRVAAEFGREVLGFDPEAIAAMRAHGWPGNVREMIAAIRRAVVMGNTPMIQVSDLGLAPPVSLHNNQYHVRPRPGSDNERQILIDVLQHNGQNVTRTAEALHVSRVTLYRMLRRHDLLEARVKPRFHT